MKINQRFGKICIWSFWVFLGFSGMVYGVFRIVEDSLRPSFTYGEVKERILPGMTKFDVKAYLGDPDEGEDSHVWMYRQSQGKKDVPSLVLVLFKEGKVVNVDLGNPQFYRAK